MLKNFISKICKYKQGQKYENINIFFPFCKNVWDVKACGAWLSKGKSCASWAFKKGPMKWKMACVSLGVSFRGTFVQKQSKGCIFSE